MNATANATADGSTTVLGFTFDPNNPAVILEYSGANILATSIIPVPLAGPMSAVGTLLFGLFPGLCVNVLTSVVGAWVSLVAVRFVCHPCFMQALGKYRTRWEALDAALTSQGAQIALLIRIAPVSPMVLTNFLLSLTSIDLWTYTWTCFIGLFPANLPYAYAAQVGMSLASEFPPRDPVMLSLSILGFVATIAVAWKIGKIATQALKRHGLGDEGSQEAPSATEMSQVDQESSPGCDAGPRASRSRAEEADASASAAAAEAAAEAASRNAGSLPDDPAAGCGASSGGARPFRGGDAEEENAAMAAPAHAQHIKGGGARAGLLPSGARRFQHLREETDGTAPESRRSSRGRRQFNMDADDLDIDEDL